MTKLVEFEIGIVHASAALAGAAAKRPRVHRTDIETIKRDIAWWITAGSAVIAPQSQLVYVDTVLRSGMEIYVVSAAMCATRMHSLVRVTAALRDDGIPNICQIVGLLKC